jgi:hypothetical protein
LIAYGVKLLTRCGNKTLYLFASVMRKIQQCAGATLPI